MAEIAHWGEILEPGMYIRHQKFIDVCFRVGDVTDAVDHIKVTGYWVNMGFVHANIITVGAVTIKKTELTNWFEATDTKEDCGRNWTWRRICA